MKKNVKTMLLILAVIICCGSVLWGGVWCSTQGYSSACTKVQIVVRDSLERQFVDVDELESYLRYHGFYLKGKTMHEVDCHAIEQCLLGHDMVRSVSCYKSPFGVLHIAVAQRIPILSVVTNDGCYYVDTDRAIMPVRNQIDVDVPVLKGVVSQRAAKEEYFDFVVWLSNDHYWSKRIKNVYVKNPKHIVLTQFDSSSKILLGELEGYEQKLQRLRTLYTKGFKEIGYPDYSEYDLRYAGQVVGRP